MPVHPGRRGARALGQTVPLATLLACGIAGCAAHGDSAPSSDAATGTAISTAVLTVTPIDAPTTHAPLAAWAMSAPEVTRFADAREHATADDHEPLRLRRTRGPSDAATGAGDQALAASWRSRRAEGPAGASSPDESAPSEETFRLDVEGSVTLVSTLEHADAVITWFEPPMLVVPSRLAPGERVSQTFEMIVRPLDKPDRVKTRGPAEVAITLVGFARVRTPAGEWPAAHLRSELKATLGQARVAVTTDSWLAEGIGLVAEESRERVTVFGVPIRSVQRRWALERRD